MEDAELLASTVSVVRDSRGRFVTTGAVPHTRVLVYDANGRYLRSIGREGSGPGEFRDIELVIAAGNDSIAIVEPARRRVSILDDRGAFSRT